MIKSSLNLCAILLPKVSYVFLIFERSEVCIWFAKRALKLLSEISKQVSNIIFVLKIMS